MGGRGGGGKVGGRGFRIGTCASPSTVVSFRYLLHSQLLFAQNLNPKPETPKPRNSQSRSSQRPKRSTPKGSQAYEDPTWKPLLT